MGRCYNGVAGSRYFAPVTHNHMEKTNEQFEKLVEKIRTLQKGHKLDLSLEEDLSIGIMNLVSLEEHFYFTGIKTDKEEYFDLLNEVRTIRKDLLARMIDTHEGETWCIAKHLLAGTMRLIEVGTKYLSDGKKEDAHKVFDQGSKLYSLFWGLRLKLISTSDVKKIGDGQLNVHDKKGELARRSLGGGGSRPWKYEDIVKKLVDCCNESR